MMYSIALRALRESTALVLVAALLFVSIFLAVEPTVAKGQSEQFTISMTVTDEISFLFGPNNIALGTLSGITGGTSVGETTVRVRTNNADGFNMTLTASSSAGMEGVSTSGVIPAYTPALAGTPDYTFITPANSARFGYSVLASTSAEVVQAFRNDGDDCGIGALNTVGNCWLNATTGPMTIINTTAPSPASGATSTIQFRVTINADPSPAIPNDLYRATTTLTIAEN
jgi:hypothetical protein